MKKRDKAKMMKIDSFYYALYLPDEETPESIEERFKLLEMAMKENEGETTETT